MDFFEPTTPKVGDQVGPFQLVSLLGQGGYGLVFRAQHVRLEDDFAVKVMMPSFARTADFDSLSKRFVREVSLLKKLRHPHIVRVVDVGRTEHDLPYYAMEFVEGPTLSQLIKTEPLTSERVAHIAQQILSALENAHAVGIIHRDLKPSNIILRHDYGWDDYVTVIDFGIAKLLDADVELTAGGQSFGSPQYLSPEQLNQPRQIDGRADLYSLGLIMAECLTGQPVVSSTKALGAAVVHLFPTPHNYDIIVKESPLFSIIDRVTQKERDKRYPSANKMRLVLESTGLASALPAAPLSFRETSDAPKQTTDVPLTLPTLPRQPPTTVDQLQPPTTPQMTQTTFSSSELASVSQTNTPRLWILAAMFVGLATVVAVAIWLTGNTPTSNEPEEETLAAGSPEGSAMVQPEPTVPVVADADGEAGSPELDGVASRPEIVEPDDGIRHRQLTFEPSENPPSWSVLSSDGRYVAFSSFQGLTIVDVVNQESTEFPHPHDRRVLFVDWYPDGQSLVTEEMSLDGTRSLWRFSVVDGARTLIEVNARAPGLSPDGTLLAFLTNERIAVRNLSTSELVGTFDLSGRLPFEGVIEWSPTGESLAFLAYFPLEGCNSAALFTIVLATGKLEEIVGDPQLCVESAAASVVWLSDRRVVFSRGETARELGPATSNLWSIEVNPTTGRASSEPTRLTDTHDFQYLSLSASADSSLIGYTRFGRQLSVHITNLDEAGNPLSEVRRIVPDGFDLYPTGWSIDGENLYLTTGRAGAFDMVAVDVRTGDFQPQVTGDDWDWLAISSPDGQWLVYWETTLTTAGQLETSQLMRMPLAGGPAAPITERYLASHPPFQLSFKCSLILDDGCVFAEIEDQELVFRRLDPVEGLGERIISINLSNETRFTWDLSPNASLIALGLTNRLLIANLENGMWTENPTRFEGRVMAVSWESNNADILVSVAWGRELNRVNLSGDIEPVYGPRQAWVMAPLASPSGQDWAILESLWDLNVWVLEGM